MKQIEPNVFKLDSYVLPENCKTDETFIYKDYSTNPQTYYLIKLDGIITITNNFGILFKKVDESDLNPIIKHLWPSSYDDPELVYQIIKQKDIKSLHHVLTTGIDFQMPEHVLYQSAIAGSIEMFKLLLQHGAQINQHNLTMIASAVFWNKHDDFAKFLLKTFKFNQQELELIKCAIPDTSSTDHNWNQALAVIDMKLEKFKPKPSKLSKTSNLLKPILNFIVDWIAPIILAIIFVIVLIAIATV